MTWASTCPGAIAGLLAAFRRSLALSGVTVTRGMGITDSSTLEVVSVGFSGSPGDVGGADAQLQQEGTGGDPSRERYVIRCVISVASGDEGEAGIAAVEERAFALLGACGEAIGADVRLGGPVMSANVSSWSLDSGQVPGGVRADLRFEVSIDAYTQR